MRLTPGQYRVRWNLPNEAGDTALEGELDLRADDSPRGRIYEGVPIEREQVGEGSWHAQLPQSRDEKVLRGRLLNGAQVTLLDARLTMWSDDHATIDAAVAVVGGPLADSFTGSITSVALQIQGLDAVAGVAPIRGVQLPKREEGTRHLDWSWHADGNPESTLSWTDDDVEVELRFESSVTAPEGYFYRVSFSPVVYLSFTHSIPFRELVSNWIEPLRRLISLSTGRREAVTYVEVGNGLFDRATQHQAYGNSITQVPYASRANNIRSLHRSFTFAGGPSLLNMVRAWQDLEAEHHPVLETYAALMYAPTQHPRSRLLMLLQALEGLHGHESREAYSERSARHRAERDLALSEVVAAQVSPETKKFIRRHLANRPATSLDQVLRDTLAGLPRNITADLAASELIRLARTDPRNPASPFDALRIIRNDLAHGNKGYDAALIHDVVKLLDAAVRAHLLRLLGCDAASQEREQERAHL